MTESAKDAIVDVPVFKIMFGIEFDSTEDTSREYGAGEESRGDFMSDFIRFSR